MAKVRVIVFLLLFFLSTLSAQDKNIWFEKITSVTGVISLIRDHHGQIWLATFDGLMKYEGYDLLVNKN